jgi:DNA-binding response OmpR family regulator
MTDHGAKILLIDDDTDMYSIVEMMLAGEGYQLTCCRTGAAGLEAMRRQRPDLLLLDIMLSDSTEGLQVACQMRQDERLKTIPIVFLSSIGESMGAEYGKEVCPIALDADMFVEKPFDASTIREAIKWVLQQKPPAAP